jgi:transposase
MAVKEHLEKGKTYRYLGDKYGVSPKTVEGWVRIYKRDNGLDIKKKGRPREENINYKERYEILKKFLEFLDEEEQDKR